MMNWINIRPEELVHEVSRLDTAFWSSLLSKEQGLRTILPRRADKVTAGDLFTMLYQWNPQLDDEPVDPALKAWLERAMENPSIRELREKTVGDRMLSSSSSIRLYRELMRPQESQIKTIVQLKHNLDTLKALDQSEQGQETMARLQQQMADEYQDMSDKDVLGEISMAADNTAQDLDAAKEMAGISGYSINPDDMSERTMKGMLNETLVDKVTKNDKVRAVVSIMGRMKPILEVAKSQILKEQPTPVDLVYGRDLDKLVPTELVTLADPDLEDLFWTKFIDGGLLQYEHRDKPQEGRGPFVCLLDISGSMRGVPEQYGLALFSAMTRLALRDKREVVLCYFADNASKPYKVTDGESLVNALSASPKVGYGTDFNVALQRAQQIINDGIISKQADILLISDGYAEVLHVDLYTKWKTANGIKMIGININGNWSQSYIKMFDAVTSMGSRGDMSKLDWLDNMKGRLVS